MYHKTASLNTLLFMFYENQLALIGYKSRRKILLTAGTLCQARMWHLWKAVLLSVSVSKMYRVHLVRRFYLVSWNVYMPSENSKLFFFLLQEMEFILSQIGTRWKPYKTLAHTHILLFFGFLGKAP